MAIFGSWLLAFLKRWTLSWFPGSLPQIIWLDWSCLESFQFFVPPKFVIIFSSTRDAFWCRITENRDDFTIYRIDILLKIRIMIPFFIRLKLFINLLGLAGKVCKNVISWMIGLIPLKSAFKHHTGLCRLVGFYRTTAMLSAVYAVVVCLSVCLCVCLSHSGIVSKRLNVGSRKQRRTIAPWL